MVVVGTVVVVFALNMVEIAVKITIVVLLLLCCCCFDAVLVVVVLKATVVGVL